MKVFGQDYKVISVGKARKALHKWHFSLSACEKTSQAKKDVFIKAFNVLKEDFSTYAHKILVSESKQNKSLNSKSSIKKYFSENYFYLVEVDCQKSSIIALEMANQAKVFDQSLTGTRSVTRSLLHQIAASIYKRAYNEKSVFQEKIAFAASARSSLSKTQKELYVMDFDGKNPQKLTNHGGVVLSPAFSPDNSRVLYSVIQGGGVKLYEIDLRTRQKRLISGKKGINSGAVYTPDGKGVYLTLSFSGNADIYYMDLGSKSLRKVTGHFGVDVDPSIDKTGKLMSFLSSRSGQAMIYTLDPSGTEKGIKRVSFVGKFNATPRFSPSRKEIVFASWVNNTFDLFRIYPNGQSLVRLTSNFGSNEDPSYSPDGEFIAFSSKRVITRKKIDQNIYIMSRNGENVRKISTSLGHCSAPRFTN